MKSLSPPLTAGEYFSWSSSLEAISRGEGIWSFVNGLVNEDSLDMLTEAVLAANESKTVAATIPENEVSDE